MSNCWFGSICLRFAQQPIFCKCILCEMHLHLHREFGALDICPKKMQLVSKVNFKFAWCFSQLCLRDALYIALCNSNYSLLYVCFTMLSFKCVIFFRWFIHSWKLLLVKETNGNPLKSSLAPLALEFLCGFFVVCGNPKSRTTHACAGKTDCREFDDDITLLARSNNRTSASNNSSESHFICNAAYIDSPSNTFV